MSDKTVEIDFSFFTSDEAKKKTSIPDIVNNDADNKPIKRKTLKKSDINTPGGDGLMYPIPGADIAEVNYEQSYAETTNIIKGAIAQVDKLSAEVINDLEEIRTSKTLKNKHKTITDMALVASNLINTKISAAKEINNTVNQIHNLNMNRFKITKMDQKDANDEKTMMDIYASFVNTPVGTYTAPSIQDLTLGVNAPSPNVNAIEMIAPPSGDSKNLTPEQNRMRMESNKSIQAVVRYDQSTGQRCFDVIDVNTGMSVPNYPRPDAFLLEDTTIDVHSKIARNRNINMVWPLVIEGSNTMVINEY